MPRNPGTRREGKPIVLQGLKATRFGDHEPGLD
jgi:hypothetical protein